MDATERVPPLCVVAPRWRTGRLRRQDATERVPCDRVVVEASGRGRHLFPTSFCVRRSRILCVLVKKTHDGTVELQSSASLGTLRNAIRDCPARRIVVEFRCLASKEAE